MRGNNRSPSRRSDPVRGFNLGQREAITREAAPERSGKHPCRSLNDAITPAKRARPPQPDSATYRHARSSAARGGGHEVPLLLQRRGGLSLKLKGLIKVRSRPLNA